MFYKMEILKTNLQTIANIFQNIVSSLNLIVKSEGCTNYPTTRDSILSYQVIYNNLQILYLHTSHVIKQSRVRFLDSNKFDGAAHIYVMGLVTHSRPADRPNELFDIAHVSGVHYTRRNVHIYT